ncbi:putative glycosyltransferase [Quercus suber]|uniref:Glycosyltransferase n=1 Tax=Quercus suber TaxID=58331 RepID=A0AAW0J7H6_QUESU
MIGGGFVGVVEIFVAGLVGEDTFMIASIADSELSSCIGNYVNYNEVYHDRDTFVEDYKEMNRSFKIYVYPHRRNDPFANVLLPVGSEPGDLFFLPFSIARLRHDPRIGVGGIQDFIKDYILNISQKYPYWNRTGGADHFYVACHSIGRSAMDKANEVKFNAIQVVCSSTYFQPGYIAHKDACLPQIWPRQGVLPNLSSSNG